MTQHTAAAQKTIQPYESGESAFSGQFYKPYTLAAQRMFLLCCRIRDERRADGEDPGVCEMTYRLKTPASISGKLLDKGLPVCAASAGSALRDVAGLRIILESTAQVYRFAALIARSGDAELLETRDYIKQPKPSGYRSLHLILGVPVHTGQGQWLVPVEVQLRTPGMNIWASIEHEMIYKPAK